MNISICTTKGPNEGKLTISDMSRDEAFEVYFALIQRHNAAKSRLNGSIDYQTNKAYDRTADVSTVRTCREIADALRKQLD